jgi:CIC family chloride channel protein
LLLPALWVSVLAYLLGRRWSLYRSQVPTRFDSPAHRGDYYVDVLGGLRVADVVEHRPPRTLPESASLDQILQTFSGSEQHYYPVVDGNGVMTGILSVNDLQQLLDDRDAGPLIIAQDIARNPVVSVAPEDDLNLALQRFSELDVEELPVVAGASAKVLAMLTRRQVIAAYNRERLRHLRAATRVP